MGKDNKITSEFVGVIDEEWGTLKPVFHLPDGKQEILVVGQLKYFQKYKGKKCKITIEIID